MKGKGLFFSVMFLLLALTMISINSLLSNSTSFSLLPFSQLLQSSARFDNIDRSIIDFYRVGYNKIAVERALPFNYSINDDSNSITIIQQLPISQSKFDTYFDLLSLSEVFFEDANRSNVFDGVIVDLNVPKNTAWGGAEKNLAFLINPFCYGYSALDLNEFSFARKYSEECTRAFSSDSIKRIDINFDIHSNEDFDSLKCNGAVCPTDAFDPESLLPYYSIRALDANCSSCNLSQKTASAHFDPSVDLNITLSCSGQTCSSFPFIVRQKNLDFNFSQSAGRVNVATIKIVFNERVKQFFVLGIKLGVYTSGDYGKTR
jgi:hypothetical protein